MDLPAIWTQRSAEEAARALLAEPHPARALRALMQETLAEDWRICRRAANILRLVSQRRPGLLSRYADLLAERAAELPLAEWPSRCYLLLAAAHNAQSAAQRRRIFAQAQALAGEERIAVRASALEIATLVAGAEAELRAEALLWLEAQRREAAPAVRARARRMLALLQRGKMT